MERLKRARFLMRLTGGTLRRSLPLHSPFMCQFRIALAPPFPGLRRFKQGRNFQQWTGDDSKALMKVCSQAVHCHNHEPIRCFYLRCGCPQLKVSFLEKSFGASTPTLTSAISQGQTRSLGSHWIALMTLSNVSMSTGKFSNVLASGTPLRLVFHCPDNTR